MTIVSQAEFERLAQRVCDGLPQDVRLQLYLAAEASTFLRFNRSRLRQLTQVDQCMATVTVIMGRRRLSATLGIAPHGAALAADTERLVACRDRLLAEIADAPEDPHLLLPAGRQDTVRDEPQPMPAAERIATAVVDAAAARRQPGGQPLDLVGFYAGGPCVRALADSNGQRNWHRVDTFLLEWSLYSSADPAIRDRAVKSRYAGSRWDDAEFQRRLDVSVSLLEPLAMPDQTLAPGRYRALLMPEAVSELMGGMAWGGFGLKERKTGTSPLSAFARGEARFAPVVSLTESVADGLAPRFTSDGFVMADRVPLIEAGRLPSADAAVTAAGAAGALVGPRSAAEYGTAPNAGDSEFPMALSLAAGTLPMAEALAALGDGILIGNLWYLNFSDRTRGRVTGMTRFASFRVADGRIVAPIGVMRFDDSLFDLFGQRCAGLTDVAEFLPSAAMGARTLQSTRCPALLVDGIDLTL